MAKLFEEDNGYTGETIVVSNEDVVDGINDATEATEAYVEATEQIDLYVATLENRDVLENMVDRQQEIMDNGKADTASAAMAQAALESICVTLGASPEVYNISTESMTDTPAIAMQASLEGANGVLDKVLNALKAFVAKIVQFVRKATLKVITAVSRVEKSAKAFKDTLAKDDKTGATKDGVSGYPEGISKGIKSKFGTYLASGLGFGEGAFTALESDIGKIKGNLDNLAKVTKDDFTKDSSKSLLTVKGQGKIYDILGNPDKLFTNFPTEYNTGSADKFITRYDGNMFRVAMFKTEVKDGKTTHKSVYFEGTVKAELLKNTEFKNLIPYNKLDNVASVAEKIAKDMKDLVDAGDKALDNVKKIVDSAKTDIEKVRKEAVDAADKDDADATVKAAGKAAQETARVALSDIDSFAHVVPKAVLDSAWMAYRTSTAALWVAQKTYGLYK